MGAEKILFAIVISVLALSNIITLLLLVNKNKRFVELKCVLKRIVIKNSNLFKRLDSATAMDLAGMLDDKILFLENETKELRKRIISKRQKISKLESLNKIVNGHVNNLNKDLTLFISRLNTPSTVKANRDLDGICIEFKTALYKARQFFEGLYVRTELLQAVLNKTSEMKDQKVKNTSIIAVKTTKFKNKLYALDKILYNQNSELLDIVDVVAKIQDEYKTKIKDLFDKQKLALQKELNKKSDLRKRIKLNFDRHIKDLKFVEKELDIILENYRKESSSNRGEAVPVIVNDIKQKISDIENELQSSGDNNTEIISKIAELENSDNVFINQLLKDDALFEFENNSDAVDHYDIRRVVAKTIKRNEYLLQTIGDLIKESCITEELSNSEWEKLREEGVLLTEMKKNVSLMFNLLNSINMDSDSDEKLEIDLSDFSISEDGEILI